MKANDVKELAALGMVGCALLVISWLALTGNSDAITALIALLSAGTGWAFRGKLEAK